MSGPPMADRSARCVLVVDDNAAVRAVVRRALETAGYQVWEAADGLEAWAILEQHGPLSAVIADIRMPNMDGWELAARLAKHSPRIPILFISAYDAHWGSATLPGPILAKPFRAETLIGRLSQLLTAEQRSA